jgi:hypothetical protein
MAANGFSAGVDETQAERHASVERPQLRAVLSAACVRPLSEN